MSQVVFLGLGSNQGEKIKNCEQAIGEILRAKENAFISRSSWHYCEPWGKEDQDWFINGVLQIRTTFSPFELLARIKEIEKFFGRSENVRWGPRIIDIDILFYDNLTIKSPEAEIPHPWIAERNFVLIPLAEIAPQFIHPVFKKTIKELLALSPDRKKVIKVRGKICE